MFRKRIRVHAVFFCQPLSPFTVALQSSGSRDMILEISRQTSSNGLGAISPYEPIQPRTWRRPFCVVRSRSIALCCYVECLRPKCTQNARTSKATRAEKRQLPQTRVFYPLRGLGVPLPRFLDPGQFLCDEGVTRTPPWSRIQSRCQSPRHVASWRFIRCWRRHGRLYRVHGARCSEFGFSFSPPA